jgi:hypothetical protein
MNIVVKQDRLYMMNFLGDSFNVEWLIESKWFYQSRVINYRMANNNELLIILLKL